MEIYVVQPGDTLYRIASEHRVSAQYLAEINQLQNPNQLTIGQTVVIPGISEFHVVQRGESLWSIAELTGTTVLSLLQMNPQLNGQDRIQPGQILAISYQMPKIGTLAVNAYAYPNMDTRLLRQVLPYITYLAVFSYNFSASGVIYPQNTEGLVNLAWEFGAKPIMVLTALNEEGYFSGERASGVLNDMMLRETLFESILQTLRIGDYAGIEIDFEYVLPEDQQAFSAFVRDSRVFLEPYGYEVAVALAPKTSSTQVGVLYEAHDYEEMGKYTDKIMLMTYQWGYTWSEPMAVAPLNQVERVLSYATSVMSPNKILMGIPNYGYDWKLPFIRGETRAMSISPTLALAQATELGAPVVYDEIAQTPHYNYWRDHAEHEVWFEDARSIDAKLSLASAYGLHGISIWNLMRTFPQLWLVLSEKYNILKF